MGNIGMSAKSKPNSYKQKLRKTKRRLDIAQPNSSMNEQGPITKFESQCSSPVLVTPRKLKYSANNLFNIRSWIHMYYFKQSQFAMLVKEAFKLDNTEDAQENLENFFVPLFQECESDIVRRFLAAAPGYLAVSYLVEKYIAEKMYESFLDMEACHDEEIYEREVEKAVSELSDKLNVIYNTEQCGMRSKIQDLAKMAANLSLRIREQSDSIIVKKLMPNDLVREQATIIGGDTSEGSGSILLGIRPVYLIRKSYPTTKLNISNEDDTYLEDYEVLFTGEAISDESKFIEFLQKSNIKIKNQIKD